MPPPLVSPYARRRWTERDAREVIAILERSGKTLMAFCAHFYLTLHSANVLSPNLCVRHVTISIGRNPPLTRRVHSSFGE